MASTLVASSDAGAGPADAEADDAVLVVRARADRRAFAPLYRRYVDHVYRYCYARLGGREAAEDATSLVFARALANLEGCRPESFRSWLFAIAHHALADELRRRAGRPSSPLTDADALPDPAAGPEAAALAAESRRTLLSVLAALPEEQRCVVELRLAGLKGPEIARALGRTPGAVRVAQHRAIVRLRGLLADATPPDPLEQRHG